MTEYTTPPGQPPEPTPDMPPASLPVQPASPPVVPGITLRTSEALRRTKPWVMFISVLMWIAVGFMLLGAVFILFAGFAGSLFGESGVPEGLMMALMALIYVVMAILYIFPAILLWRYGSRIGRMLATASVSELEGALEAQKSFWKFIGIFAIALIGFYGLLVVAMMVVGVIGAFR